MKIISIAVSKSKGTRKEPIEQVRLVKEHGIEGDAHARAMAQAGELSRNGEYRKG